MEQITETGIKGFLKWFAQEQPELYKKIAPEITNKVPAAFSDYHAGGWRVAGLSHSDAVAKLGALSDDSLTPINVTASTLPAIDVSTAANAGSASTSTTGWISNIVQGISALYLTKQQADIQHQVVNTQLARAAAGLSPLPSSLANMGVPQVSVGLSSGTGTALAIGAAAVLGFMLFAGKGKRTA